MIGRSDLVAVLSTLAERRPVFHSEADFQHELAWTIRERHPRIEVRLERPVSLSDERGHVDVWVLDGSYAAPIELKYWTQAPSTPLVVHGERYYLTDQGAQPLRRYDLWKDISRMELLISQGSATNGYAVALTNVRTYWTEGRTDVIDAAFRTHPGREVHGELAWQKEPADGTIAGRRSPIGLAGRYVAQWERYSMAAEGPGGDFRYLLLDVREGLTAATGRTLP